MEPKSSKKWSLGAPGYQMTPIGKRACFQWPFLMILNDFWAPLGLPFRHLFQPWATKVEQGRRQEWKKCEKEESRKGSWKRALSGRGQTLKSDDSYTLSAVFQEAKGSQKGTQMEAKMVPKSIRSCPRASFGELLGSIFGSVFSTLFLNVEMVAKMVPNGRDPGRGLPSKIRVSPPLGLSPSQLPLKGTPTTFKVPGRFPEYIPVVTRGTGKRRKKR